MASVSPLGNYTGLCHDQFQTYLNRLSKSFVRKSLPQDEQRSASRNSSQQSQPVHHVYCYHDAPSPFWGWFGG